MQATEAEARRNGKQARRRTGLPGRGGRLKAKRQRSSVFGWLAILFLILFTVSALAAWNAARARQPYLALARPVAAGAVISDGDLVRIDAAVDGKVNLVGDADRRKVVGKVAARSLRAGDPLTPTDWIDGAGPGAGRVVVPVTLSGDRVPGRLDVGDRIRLVRTAAGIGRESGEPVVLTDDGVVFEITSGSRLSERTVVSVSVLEQQANAVAAASSEGRVAVVLLGRA